MASASLRSASLARLVRSSVVKQQQLWRGSSIACGSSTAVRFLSTEPAPIVLTEEQKAFQEQGILDERGLTIFDTLHDMQVRSCQVFNDRKLFGTYSEETKDFEWMSFADYDHKVNQCRAVLKDLGTIRQSLMI